MKKKCWLALMLALCAVFMVGCKPKNELHIYSWADYISPELISKFERLHDCSVYVDTFDSNEMMYSKLQAGGSGYDIIIPSHYFVKKMAKSGLIAKLDKSQLPKLANVDPGMLQGLGTEVTDYAVPYFMGATGLGYSTAIKDFKPTWNVFLREDLKGYMTLLDDYNEVLGAAMVTLGLSVEDVLEGDKKDENLEKVVQQAISWLDNVIKFENEQYKNGLAAGEFKVVMGYSSDLGQLVMENPDTL
ncbi:MAG: spermidine/putrescine ABC transporter substrate-binding protein, partial [Victivallales bacterium]|nr:spermidine/putrescine ABC transporter substrate-binding protein [Victivallales bacterium]